MEAGAITVRTVGTFLMATWPRRLVVGGLLLVPVIVAVLGGFGKAEPRMTVTAPGEPVDLGPMTVTPTGYFVSDTNLRSDLDTIDGDAWVGVLARVENTTTEAIPLDFPGPASEAFVPVLPQESAIVDHGTAYRVQRVADASSGSRALPGVPAEVALLWPISAPDALGDTLTLSMTESEWTRSVMSTEMTWLAIGDRWTVDLPLVDIPQSLVEPEPAL